MKFLHNLHYYRCAGSQNFILRCPVCRCLYRKICERFAEVFMTLLQTEGKSLTQQYFVVLFIGEVAFMYLGVNKIPLFFTIFFLSSSPRMGFSVCLFGLCAARTVNKKRLSLTLLVINNKSIYYSQLAEDFQFYLIYYFSDKAIKHIGKRLRKVIVCSRPSTATFRKLFYQKLSSGYS